MTSQEKNHIYFLDAKRELELDKHQVAKLCGVHIRTVERWIAGTRKVSNTVINFLDVCWMVKVKYPHAWDDVMVKFFREEV